MTSAPHRPPQAVVHTSDFGQWVDAVNRHFLPLEGTTAPRERFKGGFRVRPVGCSVIGLVATTPCAVMRTRRLAERSEHGYFKMVWQLEGRSQIEQGGATLAVQPGHLAIYDTTRPYRLDMGEGCRIAVLTLSADRRPEWRRLLEAGRARVMPRNGATSAGLAALLSLLQEPPEDDGCGEGVVDAVSTLVLGTLPGRDAESRSAPDERRLQEARRVALRHLDDPDLGPDLLAQALGISRRSLYLLFRRHGTTPAGFILDLRLDRCRNALEDPAAPRRTLTEIAYDHGFSDSAYFSRAFRAHFGVCPSVWREQRGRTSQ